MTDHLAWDLINDLVVSTWWCARILPTAHTFNKPTFNALSVISLCTNLINCRTTASLAWKGLTASVVLLNNVHKRFSLQITDVVCSKSSVSTQPEQSRHSLCNVNEGYFPCCNPMFQWSKSPPVDRTCTQLLQDCHVGCSAIPLVLCKVVLRPSLMILVHQLVSGHLHMQSHCRPL